MDLKEIDWLLRDKYKLNGILSQPEKWPSEVEKDINRLESGEPLAYVIGFIPFLGCHIDLSMRPLIPRTETEYWAEKMISQFKLRQEEFTCLDLFSGSGCLGLSLSKHCSRSKVDFADNSDNCIKQIKINLSLNNIGNERSKIIKSDLFDRIKDKYDLILANPPYLNQEQIECLTDSVKNYEPIDALAGGEEGLYFIEKFLFLAKRHLKKGGEIWLEFDSSQKKDIQNMANKYDYRCELGKDQFNSWRFSRMTNFD